MSDEEPTVPQAVPADVEGQAAFWRINRKTILRWRNAGAPITDIPAMIEWARKKDVPEGFAAKVGELTGTANLPAQTESDWAELEEKLRNLDPKASMENIERLVALVTLKFNKASQSGDRKGEKHYGDLVAKFEAVKHDALLRAKKLGIDSGELIKRELVAAYAESLGFWLLRGADEAINEITPKLIAASARGQLGRDTIIEILEPALLGSRVVNPLTRSTTTTANNAVPDWLADAIKRGLAQVIEPEPPKHDL